MVSLQLRQSAAAMANRPELRRMIWLASGISPGTSEQTILWEALANCDAARAPLLPNRDEIISGDYDSFLALVQRTLRQKRPPEPVLRPSAKSLWIAAADDDVGYARSELRRALRNLGALVEVPLPQDRDPNLRANHEAKRLHTADAVIVLWGSQRVEWVEDQLFRLRQLSFARGRPFDWIALAILGPDTYEKQNEEPAGPDDILIDLRSGLDGPGLDPLARRLVTLP
jgi:hypothetical protein